MSVIFLVGPTASGKTKVSIELAGKLNAEIISCDSMCVYRGMDILTSKPSAGDRKKIKHHLIDIIPPTEEFSVAEYRRMALEKIKDILKRKKTPLFVGGSGLYVKALIDGLFPSAQKDPRFRKGQEALAKKYGREVCLNDRIHFIKDNIPIVTIIFWNVCPDVSFNAFDHYRFQFFTINSFSHLYLVT